MYLQPTRAIKQRQGKLASHGFTEGMNFNYIYEFRIVVIGDLNTGKSTLIGSYINDRFDVAKQSTVSIGIFMKIVQLESDLKIRLQIWDTAGQERFKAMTQSYYRRSQGIILVYDASERSSFCRLVDWLHDAKRYAHNVVFQLVACKSDFRGKKKAVDTEEARAFANFHEMDFIETSAKELYNVEKAFKTIAKAIYTKVEKGELKAERVELTRPTPSLSVKGSCKEQTHRGTCQFC